MGRSDFIGLPNVSLAGREWPDGPNKKWLEGLQRPDNEQNPYRKLDPKSLSGCGAGDTVQAQFKVEAIATARTKKPHALSCADRFSGFRRSQWALAGSGLITSVPKAEVTQTSYCRQRITGSGWLAAGKQLKEAQEVRPPRPFDPSKRVPTRRKSCMN
jgi:hypothetical protein